MRVINKRVDNPHINPFVIKSKALMEFKSFTHLWCQISIHEKNPHPSVRCYRFVRACTKLVAH